MRAQALVPVLLARGANPDTPTIRGSLTPLHLACAAGNSAVVELLVRHGCAIAVQDSFNMTPSEHAFSNGFTDLHEWLVEKSGGDKEQRRGDREMEAYKMSVLPLTDEGDSPGGESPASVERRDAEIMPPPLPQRGGKGGKKLKMAKSNEQKEMLQVSMANPSSINITNSTNATNTNIDLALAHRMPSRTCP